MSEIVAAQSGNISQPFSPELFLDGHYAAFVESQVTNGKFSSPMAVVQAGLRLLEEQDKQLATLQQALIEGEQSGEPVPFDNNAFLGRIHAKYAAD